MLPKLVHLLKYIASAAAARTIKQKEPQFGISHVTKRDLIQPAITLCNIMLR